jgi:hypothetical protein
MDFGAIVDTVFEFMRTAWASIIFSIVVIVIAVTTMVKKNNKTKLLKEDDRFIYAKIFTMDIKTPIAVSDDGLIGFILPNISYPVVLSIKDLKRIVFSTNNFIVADSSTEESGLLFRNIVSRIGAVMDVKTKNVSLKLWDSDNSEFEIPLFVNSLKRALIPNERQQKRIKALLSALEETEKKVKGNP